MAPDYDWQVAYELEEFRKDYGDPAGQLFTLEITYNATTYVYDAASNRIATVDPLGNRTTVAYYAANRPTSVTDPLNHTLSYGYDAVGNRTSVTDALNHTTTSVYDALNRLATDQNVFGQVLTYSYDPANRLTLRQDSLGGVGMDDRETVNQPIVVQDVDTTPIRQGWNDQVGELLELGGRVERRRQERTGLSEEMPSHLGLLTGRNVAGNLRGPDDPASTIPDRRDGEGDIQASAIFVQPLSFVMIDALPTLQAFEQMWKIIN